MKVGSLSIWAALTAWALAGCSLVAVDCHKPGVYAEAQSIAPLRVPAGLDAPDTKSALKVPDLTQPERPRGPNEPCLDAPPRYTAPPARKPLPQA